MQLRLDPNKLDDATICADPSEDRQRPFTVSSLACDGNATAFSDRQVESGITYRYRITATDRSGNESEPSKVLEIKAP